MRLSAELAGAYLELGRIQVGPGSESQLGEDDQALQSFGRGIALIERALKHTPPTIENTRTAFNLHAARTSVLGANGRAKEALADFEQALKAGLADYDALAKSLGGVAGG